MTLLQSIVLGIIQGLTEFLPISSSAHLVITPYILGWKIPAQAGFVFDVLVQVRHFARCYFILQEGPISNNRWRDQRTDPQATLFRANLPPGLDVGTGIHPSCDCRLDI